MKILPVHCSNCNNIFLRTKRQINEAEKFGWRQFCSKECHSLAKNKQQILQCSNPECQKIFKREIYKKSKEIYCSRSCAAYVNNSKFPKRHAVIKICAFCGKEFTTREKYCSVMCKVKGQQITKEVICAKIQEFYAINRRIPFKREFSHARAARERFGSWNNAIIAAGLNPNPVMFARKYVAHDGHKCDSLAEKIIDDWLYAKNVEHKRSVSYPSNNKLTADFLVGECLIEFFGLFGEHKRYDELRKEKLHLVKKHKLQLIEIFPLHLFPKNKLSDVLSDIIRI